MRVAPGYMLPCLISLLLIASGCSHLILRPDDDAATTTAKVTGRLILGIATVPVFIVGLHSEVIIARIKDSVPITDGAHTKLPPTNATVVVLGTHPIDAGAAVTWLQKRGMTILERSGLQKVLSEQQFRLTHTPDDEAGYLKVGKLIGASAIVFVETSESGNAVNWVSVRAVDVESGSIAWTGRAHYRKWPTGAPDLSSPEDSLVKLVCQALATAWGFRPPGDHFIPSQEMCELKEHRPKSNGR